MKSKINTCDENLENQDTWLNNKKIKNQKSNETNNVTKKEKKHYKTCKKLKKTSNKNNNFEKAFTVEKYTKSRLRKKTTNYHDYRWKQYEKIMEKNLNENFLQKNISWKSSK